MSAPRQGRRGQSNPLDFFATPPEATRAILPHLPRGMTLLDPCAGDGAILQEARGVGYTVRGFELDLARCNSCAAREMAVEHRDALAPEPWGAPHLVVANPAYSWAESFVSRSLEEIGQGGTVAMLLRLEFLSSAKRAPIHKAHPSDVYVLDARPSYTGDGGHDRYSSAWFVWGPGRGGRWFHLTLPRS